MTTHTMLDSAQFRAALGRFATGVTVISHAGMDGIHAMTANAFLSVSLRPPLVLVSLGERARMHGLLTCGARFGVSVLAAHQTSFSDHFAGRTVTPPPLITWNWTAGVPVLDGAVAHVTAEVVATHTAGDHTLFIGHVEHLAHSAGQPLIFHAGAYAQLAPVTAN